MKHLRLLISTFISLALLIASAGYAEEYSKKDLKRFSKNLTEYNKGKIFQKSDRIAIVGPSINFRLAAKQTEAASWKDKHWVKFSAIAKLEGISDELMQEITDEYSQMVAERLSGLGLAVVPLSEAEQAKSWSKLVENGTPSGEENSKKNWGVAKKFAPTGQQAIYYKHAAPFGPHRKLPKELKAILYNSNVQLDFATIGVDVSSSKSDYGSHSIIYTEGKSSIVPEISIAAGTFSVAIAKKGEHNLVAMTDEHAAKLNIRSTMPYADSTEKCSPCELGFSTGGFIKDNNIDVVKIHANPEKFKAAALDALSNYLDTTIALYTR